MLRWADENLLELKREEIGEYYGRYRLHVPEAERAMARSLERYGQLSPVVVCRDVYKRQILDTDTTVHTLYGQQMGGRKGYNPKNKGKKSYCLLYTSRCV